MGSGDSIPTHPQRHLRLLDGRFRTTAQWTQTSVLVSVVAVMVARSKARARVSSKTSRVGDNSSSKAGDNSSSKAGASSRMGRKVEESKAGGNSNSSSKA